MFVGAHVIEWFPIFLYSLIISLITGVAILFLRKNDHKISIFDKIFAVILGYLFLPFVISLPYYFSIYNISLIDSYFESISGFTSTGFTIFENIKHLDQSLILWRSTSQWIGGVYFLFSIILLIDIFLNCILLNFKMHPKNQIYPNLPPLSYLQEHTRLLFSQRN